MAQHQFNSDITASELKEKLSNGHTAFLLDVREPIEFHTFNIGGTNIPLGSLDTYVPELENDKENEIIVICQRGIRSATAQRLLISSGFKNVRNLIGGLLAYRRIS